MVKRDYIKIMTMVLVLEWLGNDMSGAMSL